MKTAANDEESEAAIPSFEKAAWIAPEISEPKDLINYPEGLVLQGASGET